MSFEICGDDKPEVVWNSKGGAWTPSQELLYHTSYRYATATGSTYCRIYTEESTHVKNEVSIIEEECDG